MSSENTPPSPSTDSTNWTDKQLPPVKPPTTGFLMQLFFVPMIIVSIIVGVWIMFGWLAQSGTNPKQLTENLRQLNKGSWQDAHSLANLLRDPREDELRKDRELASSLADTLVVLLEDPNLSISPERHKLATFLCQALGEFEVDSGVDALIEALKTDDFKIKRAGIEGIAKLSDHLQSDLDDSRSKLVNALKERAMERAPSAVREQELEYGEVRGAIAFSLGIIGGDDATDTLTLMLSDPYPEARYNAATGLARNGDVRAVERLCEMLQLDNDEAVKYENEDAEELRQWKNVKVVILNGVRGVHALYTKNQQAKPDDAIINAVAGVADAGVLKGNDAYQLDVLLQMLKDRS